MPLRTYNRPSKANILYLNTEEKYRDAVVSLSKRTGWQTFLKNSYNNPFVYYEFVSQQLALGTHKFDIKTLDALSNISQESSTQATIADFRLPPRFLIGSISGSTVTLSWEHSIEGAPDNYLIFGSSSFTTVIDKSSEFNGVSTAGTIKTVSFNVADGNYRFTVDAIKDGKTSDNAIVIRVTAPSTAVIPPTVINPAVENFINIGPLQIFGVNVPTGKLRVQFIWAFQDQVTKFRIYHDNSTGTVNFSNPIEFDRINSFLQDFTTNQISFIKGQKTFLFVVRSVTASGVEDGNVFEISVLLDGDVPDAPTNIKISTTFC